MHLTSELIASFNPAQPNFSPTEIYNENWLVKIALHQASGITDTAFPLSFLPCSTWFSEGLLPTAFKPRFRGDSLGESRTHADGVIGHIRIGERGKADLELSTNAKQFTVVEAKMNAPLSPGISHARYYDQAARTVACMAEVMARARVQPNSLNILDFILLAPEENISQGKFDNELNEASVKEKVERRVSAYEGQLDDWYTYRFLPTLNKIRLYPLSWEKALEWISNNKPYVADDLNEYYNLCLRYNKR
ncbi:MAG: hypothetical protein P1S60_10460 [Anaerolineae bacterium]|nr:hypothetical protein [Anaerolineae bacterium]